MIAKCFLCILANGSYVKVYVDGLKWASSVIKLWVKSIHISKLNGSPFSGLHGSPG